MPERQDIDTRIDESVEVGEREVSERPGFLPIETNWFDRIFIGVVIWVAICLLWFRFLEPIGLSIWIGNALSLVIGVYIVWKG